jgi:hypothetical protein
LELRRDGHHGQHVAAHGVADHAESLGGHVESAEDLAIRVRVLLEHDLDVGEVMLDP